MSINNEYSTEFDKLRKSRSSYEAPTSLGGGEFTCGR